VEGPCESDRLDIEASVDEAFDDIADAGTCRHQLELRSTLLENIGDGLIAHTLEGMIVYANERAGMLGTNRRSPPLGPWSWVVPEHQEHLPARITRSLIQQARVQAAVSEAQLGCACGILANRVREP
jgi:PAS domain-containing protein